MCGVIVVDVESFWSTNLGRDAYIHDHCLGYRHNYLLSYQFPNSNLFTHRMLLSREKPPVKTMAPGSISYHILKSKIPCCNFPLFNLFCVLLRSIYQISYNLIYLNTVDGLTTPLRVGLQVFVVCVQVSVAWFSYWIDNLGFITEGNTYLCCVASSLPLQGNTDADTSNLAHNQTRSKRKGQTERRQIKGKYFCVFLKTF